MRWLVEVTAIGKTDQTRYCVEAESWQRALQAARQQRGEEGPMSGFSIELLEEGYRAVDPLARIRFVVKRTADDAPLTAPPATNGTSSAAGKPSKPPPAAPKAPAAPASSKPTSKGGAPRPAAPKGETLLAGSSGAAVSAAPAPPAQAPLAAIGSTLPGCPPTKLLSKREQEPTEASPLTYREYAFSLPPNVPESQVRVALEAQLALVKEHLAGRKAGKLVNLAAFDVEWTGKPPKAPIATLTWKDWKPEPVIAFPSQGQSVKPPRPPSKAPPSALAAQAPVSVPQAPPVPSGLGAPAPVSAQPAPPAPQPVAAPPAPQPLVAAPPPAPQPLVAAPPPAPAFPAPTTGFPQPNATVPAQNVQIASMGSTQPIPPSVQPAPPPPAHTADPFAAPPQPTSPSQPPPRRPSVPPDMVRTPSGRFVRGRVSADELITALFEAMHDLHFLRDALDGGQFCLALATEVLPSRAAMIHFFDLDKRDWIVACTRGKEAQALLATRHPESDPVLREAVRARKAVVLVDAQAQAVGERYQRIGGARSLIIAPVMQAGRALGALEIVNPLDGQPYTTDEGNAMTYIAEQYAEYLGSRGIVIDRERIQASAAAR